ncbi:MAG: hypothetical protein KKG47_14775 [Proteobacteria bacterium]|nr:hypothetical protein [Pseudomonadota bacterium]MBU1739844.1 hypothetical protein [Pseudomonadota bacterium]
MKKLQLNEITRHLRQFQFILRNDREAMNQFRIIVLGLLTCFAVYYAANAVLIAPKAKKLADKIAQKEEVSATKTEDSTKNIVPLITQMQTRKKMLQEEISILKLREKLQREQWGSIGDAGRFNKVLFTMTPYAPFSIEKSLTQMIQGEKRSLEMFEEHPTRLTGSGSYHDVVTYLQYIENSPEIAKIDNLELTTVSDEKDAVDETLHFSLMVSRILLKDSQ